MNTLICKRYKWKLGIFSENVMTILQYFSRPTIIHHYNLRFHQSCGLLLY